MAQGWLALQLSDSAFIVGLVAAAGSLPILLFSLYAGVLVDRLDKLRIVTIAQVLLSLEAAVLWWAVWSGRINIPLLVGLAANKRAHQRCRDSGAAGAHCRARRA